MVLDGLDLNGYGFFPRNQQSTAHLINKHGKCQNGMHFVWLHEYLHLFYQCMSYASHRYFYDTYVLFVILTHARGICCVICLVKLNAVTFEIQTSRYVFYGDVWWRSLHSVLSPWGHMHWFLHCYEWCNIVTYSDCGWYHLYLGNIPRNHPLSVPTTCKAPAPAKRDAAVNQQLLLMWIRFFVIFTMLSDMETLLLAPCLGWIPLTKGKWPAALFSL